MFDLPRRGFLGSLIASVAGLFCRTHRMDAKARREFRDQWMAKWLAADRRRFAWGQGIDDFTDCETCPIPCVAKIDGVETDDWIDFLDTGTLEYRVIVRDLLGESILTPDGKDIVREMRRAVMSIEVIPPAHNRRCLDEAFSNCVTDKPGILLSEIDHV